jgi:flagellar biosynthesis GTPase FlhF
MAEGDKTMTIYSQKLAASHGIAVRHNIFASPVGPRILHEAPNDQGNDGGDDEAAKKAAADKAAADKAEADRLAAEKEKSGMSDADAKLLKENMEKKEALRKAQDELKKFDGIDPEEYKTLKAAAEKAAEEARAAEKAKAEAEGNTKRLLEMMKEEHQKEIEAVRNESVTTKTALDLALAQIQDLTVGSAFSQSKFVADELVVPPSAARKLFGDHFETENGVPVAYDKPKGASERTKLIDGSGNPMNFDAAIKKLVEANPDHERLIKSTMKNGAQSKTTDLPNTDKKPALFGAARIAASLANKS